MLKNKKLNCVPKMLYQGTFENLLVLDLRGNDITEIEGTICENLPMLKKMDARNNKIKAISMQIRLLEKL